MIDAGNPMLDSRSEEEAHFDLAVPRLGMAAVVTRRGSLLSVDQLWTGDLVAEARAH